MTTAANEAEALRRWLFVEAFPLWWELGADRRRGGFHDAISLLGVPEARPHRARSIARMAISYGEAGRLGWSGPWQEAQQHALDYLRRHFVMADATVASVVDRDGKMIDPAFDLYNQAFALLAYAGGHRTFGAAADWRSEATTLRTTLQQSYAHPRGGYREDRDGILPLRANPHMHLFEAALAWMVVDDDPAWRQMADDLAVLCLETLIEPATGALREFFAADWSPAPGVEGRICEPGHHYEWAFLLDHWAKLTGRSAPEAASRLVAFADRHGLDAQRGVAINAVLLDGSVHDSMARLWAQAERVRTYVAFGRADEEIAAAIKGLRCFLTELAPPPSPPPGLWYDQLTADGALVLEPARATSLYHIVGAVAELAK
jgi:mannose/cellobiose epimerase-like protein (N-acyl-D-glucosamine 2-epimerase family)